MCRQPRRFRPGRDALVRVGDPGGLAAKASRASWARLLKWVFAIDLVCPRCGTDLAVVSFITKPETIDLLLAHVREEEVDLLFDALAPPPAA